MTDRQSENNAATQAQVIVPGAQTGRKPAVAAPDGQMELRERMLARALQTALTLMSNRCRLILYEKHGQILRWLQGFK